MAITGADYFMRRPNFPECSSRGRVFQVIEAIKLPGEFSNISIIPSTRCAPIRRRVDEADCNAVETCEYVAEGHSFRPKASNAFKSSSGSIARFRVFVFSCFFYTYVLPFDAFISKQKLFTASVRSPLGNVVATGLSPLPLLLRDIRQS